MLGMKHYKVLEKLDGTKDRKTKGIIEILNAHDFVVVDYFIKSSYVDAKGEDRPCYLVTKLGCDFLANKFTGEKGILFTAKYVKRFDEMERTIQNQYKLPTTYKEALLQLVEQVEENEKLLADNNHKQEVINGLTDDVDIYKKKDVINRICRRRSGNYANRYKELYKCFKENFHIDLEARCEGYNMKQIKKKDQLSIVKYAEKFGYIDDLYSCCTKLFEAEIDEVLDQINTIHSK
jgi:Rha family phage regulatory protein